MDPSSHCRRPDQPRPGPRPGHDRAGLRWAVFITGCLVGQTGVVVWTLNLDSRWGLGFTVAGWWYVAYFTVASWLDWIRDRRREPYDHDLTAWLDRRHRDAPTTHVRTTRERWVAAHLHDPDHEPTGDHTHDGADPTVVLEPLAHASGWPRRHVHQPSDGATDPDRPALRHQRQPDRGGA